jgi:subtilisin family serine protease
MIRELEGKQALKMTTGLVLKSYIAAKRSAGNDDDAFRADFEQRLLEKLQALPWDVVGDEIEARKGSAQIFSRNLLMGIVENSMDPVVEKTDGEISADVAHGIIGMKARMEINLPLKAELVAAYKTVIDEHRVEKADIWTQRDVELDPDADLEPVTIAIWDSGVDTAIFATHDQLWRNADEKPNDRDDDENGFVDDMHGIAYDLHARPIPELLHPIDDLDHDVEVMERHMKGFTDLQAAIDSPEAAEAMELFSSLKGAEVKTFIEDLGLYGNYAHGTHVAGIAAAGNPFIRLVPVRMTFDYHMIPMKPTLAHAHREAAMWYETVDYLKRNGVRVVNMSWGGNRQSIEQALEANGAGGTAEERAELARRIFRIGRDALEEAIRSAPEILFVTSAGNADNDVEFDEMIPSGFDLPNLLVVGAVDQAGDPTDFTSFGRTVSVYANGFEVDSYVPGGTRMKLSGTSMSAPNVVNLAAKMLAIDPSLTPEQLIDMMQRHGDEVSGDEGRTLLLINPKRTIAAVRETVASR